MNDARASLSSSKTSKTDTIWVIPRTFHFSAGTLFADDNRDGVFNPPQEIVLINVTLRLLDEDGNDVIAPTTNSEFTATVYAGQTYLVLMLGDDYMQGLVFRWPWYELTYNETYSEMGLWPVTEIHYPVLLQNHGG